MKMLETCGKLPLSDWFIIEASVNYLPPCCMSEIPFGIFLTESDEMVAESLKEKKLSTHLPHKTGAPLKREGLWIDG